MEKEENANDFTEWEYCPKCEKRILHAINNVQDKKKKTIITLVCVNGHKQKKEFKKIRE